MVTVHHTRMDATGASFCRLLNFFFQKEAETLDILSTAHLASGAPLISYKKANSPFR